MVRLISYMLCCMFFYFLASCGSGTDSGYIKLDPTPPLSSGPSYVLVTKAYVAVRSGCDESSPPVFNVRGGEIYAVSGSCYGDGSETSGTGLWYKVSTEGGEGWLKSDSVAVFPTREKALKAAESYR